MKKRCLEHFRRRRELDHALSDRSRRALDWSYFFMANVEAGFGSFVAFYLANSGWSREDVGWALAIGGFAGVLSQIPCGALVDSVRAKRGLAALGFFMIGSAAFTLAFHPVLSLVLFAEVLLGLSGSIIGPALSAVTLGATAPQTTSVRIGRNLRYSAAGGVVMAVAIGALGSYLPIKSIFYIMAALSLTGMFVVGWIRPSEINYDRARNATRNGKRSAVQSIIDLVKNRRLFLFALVVALFQFANAPLLPLLSQKIGSGGGNGSLLMSGLIVGPQLLVMIFAPWASYWSELWGRKPLLIIGIGAVAARALLFSLTGWPAALVVIQLLDGATGAIITSLSLIIIVDLTAGTGRFNFVQGFVGTVSGIAASVGSAVIGAVAQRYGDRFAFLTMALVAAVALFTVWTFMPETKPNQYYGRA